jgi:putative polyhydroxyalkanoate system protein
MEITLPHAHSRADVRARLRDRTADIASFVPGGMANVDTSWSGEDRMDLVITAMGQTVSCGIDIADDHVTITVDLPFMLTMMEPMIASSIREHGPKLLA